MNAHSECQTVIFSASELFSWDKVTFDIMGLLLTVPSVSKGLQWDIVNWTLILEMLGPLTRVCPQSRKNILFKSHEIHR